MSAKLYALPQHHTLHDLPQVLRAIADQLEKGEYGTVEAIALVTEDSEGGIRTFGAGAADYYRAMALFQLALEHLVAKRGREYML